MEVPEYGSEIQHARGDHASITVHALPSNKRPVGFAPWPKTKRRNKKGKKR